MLNNIRNNKFFGPFCLVIYFAILLLCFQNNFFDTAHPRRFEIFAMGTDAFVINRIAVENKLGKEAFAGMLGRIPAMDNRKTKPRRVQRGKSHLDNYYEIFYNDLTNKNFKPYYSNLGVQGRFLGFLSRNNILQPGTNFSNYRLLFSIAAALFFTLFLYFIFTEFGFIYSLILLFSIIQADWIVSSASHFFWFSSFMFLPFILNLFLIRGYKNELKKLIVLLIAVNTSLCLLKCLFSGFEVISSFLIMNTLPAFYALLAYSISLRKFIIIFSIISVCSLAGVACSMLIQANKISLVENKEGAGKEHLISSFFRRSGGADLVKKNMSDKVKESYTVSGIQVIKKYWNSALAHLSYGDKNIPILSASMLIYLLLILSPIIYFMHLKSIIQNKKLIALLVTSWIALLSPLSMFVVFKSLSWLHPHLVPISWNMPFSFLVILTAAVFMFELIKSKKNKSNKDLAYSAD